MTDRVQQALEHARQAEDGMASQMMFAEGLVTHASLAVAYAALALVEELRRFEAVAVEERELTPEQRHYAERRYGTFEESTEARKQREP